MPPLFQYDDALLDRFPTTRGGVIWAGGLTNGPAGAALTERFLAEQAAAKRRLEGKGLGDIPALAAWRSAYRQFGVEPTRYRVASEALLRRLVKKGDLPSINALVDLVNMVSIRHALPLAIFDTERLAGTLTVRFADGSERYLGLAKGEVQHPEPGEVIFVDEAGEVHARRWCWRQSRRSAASPATTAVLITVEGHHDEAEAEIRSALDDLAHLLVAQGAGEVRRALLGPDRRSAP